MGSPQRTAATLVAGDEAAGNAAAERGRAERAAPVIVLTYAYAGARRLQWLLSGHADLACTSGTGLLPLCDQAAATWRQAEGRPEGSLSPLAAASVRALAAGMITAILVRTGARRWCETAIAQQDSAETFLRLFPETRFLCLHRLCPDVIYAALRASPWGLSGPGFAPHVAAHPASTVAAVASYWAAHTRPLLAFERAHSGACLRIRYEDLIAEPDQAASGIRTFLGLAGEEAKLPPATGNDAAAVGADAPGCGAEVPVGQFPSPLLAQVNDLLARLDYPLLDAASG